MNKEELESAFNETTNNAVNLLKENVKLKNIINKAIKNINKYERIHGINYMFENEDFKEELLNILKGEDKE